MARGALTFKQSDLTRALKGAVAAGVDVSKIEIDKDGRIVVIVGKLEPSTESRQMEIKL